MRVGVITGSGTYALSGLEAASRTVSTAFGSCELTEGALEGHEVVHLSRHGAGHHRLSSQLEHRAHVLALRDAGVQAVLAVTVCGALDPALELGSLIAFDDLHFPSNRLPSGELCTLHTEPGAPGRGHWIFDAPFSPGLREALVSGARTSGAPVRDGGVYGHVDGPRFNTRSEIAALTAAGVLAVSQTAGPEAVLCGEAGLPYALLGFATDYANGVSVEPTPVAELERLIGASRQTFSLALAGALGELRDREAPGPVGLTLGFG